MMARESVTDKAARLIASGHVRVLRANEQGIALDVLGDSSDAFQPEPYRVMRYLDASGLVESCTCIAGQAHPVRPKCSHVTCARLLWQPTVKESHR